MIRSALMGVQHGLSDGRIAPDAMERKREAVT